MNIIKKNILFAIVCGLLLPTNYIMAKSSKASPSDTKASNEQSPVTNDDNKIIDEFKEYVSKITPEIRTEIQEYRKQIAKINAEKHSIFKGLSQEAQNYFVQEKKYKDELARRIREIKNADPIATPGK